MDSFIINKFYEEDEYQIIDDILKQGTWKNSPKSIIIDSVEHQISEEDIFETELNLDKIFLEKTQNDFIFYSYCVPYSNTKVNIHRMTNKGFFRIHQDSIMYGDYATVIALNHPEEYEGGELELFVEGKELKFKLPKGFALTYKTGLLTKINTVTSGERITSTFYTKSLFSDEKVREIYSKLLYLNTKFEAKPVVHTYEEALNDPNYILGEIKDYFIHTYGNNT